MPNAGKTGLLLINLGTPAAPTTSAVRVYLRQFLSDPRVLDINPIGRFFLLNLIILPFRPRKSAAAYQKIWTEAGSPLLVESQALLEKVRKALGAEFVVELGMRYGEPSIPRAMERLLAQAPDRIVVLPLYPHYSSATAGSSLEEVFRFCAGRWNVPPLLVGKPFYEHPAFLRAFIEVGRPLLEEKKPDHILFSYHGLPERHLHKSDESGAHCLSSERCCDTIGAVNRNCYRAQCFATTRALAKMLSLSPDQYSISFQSRLGRDSWVKPYTDTILGELAKQGVKNLLVFCPAFVADCLETLEEIQIRAKETFLAAGGEDLTLVPSLNAHPTWVEAVVTLTHETLGRTSDR